MFDFLTLSVVIDDRIFCVHGGELAHVGMSSTLLTLVFLHRSFAVCSYP